jgi:hypothetical protein
MIPRRSSPRGNAMAWCRNIGFALKFALAFHQFVLDAIGF